MHFRLQEGEILALQIEKSLRAKSPENGNVAGIGRRLSRIFRDSYARLFGLESHSAA
jgi:hypothetical protein